MKMKTLEAKVVVLGSQGVGKTCMIYRFVNHYFNERVTATMGTAYFKKTLTINDVRVQLGLWDTAGQERYQSMVPLYYRDAKAALIVFDVNKSYTFMQAKFWASELRKNLDQEVFICLIGNKSDLVGWDQGPKRIPYEEAITYAKEIGGVYFEISVLKDKGVDEILIVLCDKLVKLADDPNCDLLQYATPEDYDVKLSETKPKSKKFCCSQIKKDI